MLRTSNLYKLQIGEAHKIWRFFNSRIKLYIFFLISSGNEALVLMNFKRHKYLPLHQ
ncbi:hypothetical protein BJ944DRAFT_263114 [Cunninghamella echinulata]|nr:hypothetical protein BJ944DRAFT_263114 [Cunninghamella echinulata]